MGVNKKKKKSEKFTKLLIRLKFERFKVFMC